MCRLGSTLPFFVLRRNGYSQLKKSRNPVTRLREYSGCVVLRCVPKDDEPQELKW